MPETKLFIKEIGKEQAKDFAEIVITVFGIPPSMKGIFASVVGKNNWHHYMAFDREKPAAAGSMFITGDTAWFGMATTLSEYRGKGAQGAIISARINKAYELGCKWISVETAEHTDEKPNPS